MEGSAGTTIVIVEDEPAIADALAVRLRAEGFSVAVANDGQRGVELCARVDPDLVVLDVMLPGIDGHEVCRRIQRDHPVPVLMLTALVDLVHRLALRPGIVFTRAQLLEDVWGYADGTTAGRTVDAHVAAVRRKLGADVVRTVQGIGYAFGTPGS